MKIRLKKRYKPRITSKKPKVVSIYKNILENEIYTPSVAIQKILSLNQKVVDLNLHPELVDFIVNVAINIFEGGSRTFIQNYLDSLVSDYPKILNKLDLNKPNPMSHFLGLIAKYHRDKTNFLDICKVFLKIGYELQKKGVYLIQPKVLLPDIAFNQISFNKNFGWESPDNEDIGTMRGRMFFEDFVHIDKPLQQGIVPINFFSSTYGRQIFYKLKNMNLSHLKIILNNYYSKEPEHVKNLFKGNLIPYYFFQTLLDKSEREFIIDLLSPPYNKRIDKNTISRLKKMESKVLSSISEDEITDFSYQKPATILKDFLLNRSYSSKVDLISKLNLKKRFFSDILFLPFFPKTPVVLKMNNSNILILNLSRSLKAGLVSDFYKKNKDMLSIYLTLISLSLLIFSSKKDSNILFYKDIFREPDAGPFILFSGSDIPKHYFSLMEQYKTKPRMSFLDIFKPKYNVKSIKQFFSKNTLKKFEVYLNISNLLEEPDGIDLHIFFPTIYRNLNLFFEKPFSSTIHYNLLNPITQFDFLPLKK